MSFTNHTTNTKPRLLTVSESCRYHPRITISGAWLRDWGFAIGDRVFLMSITPGVTLLRIGTRIDESDIAKYCPQRGASSKLQIRESPSYFLSTSIRDCPEIVITGAWLRDWGFAIGDRISLTRTEEDHILLKIIMPRLEWCEVLRKRKLMRDAVFATNMLERHKAAHPALYPEDAPALKRNRVVSSKTAKPSQPSLFDQIMAATHEYNAAVAARPANTPFPG